jgi:hypothetical protein
VPSFRVTMTIGALRPGVAPDAVVPHAAAAAAELTTVEASDVAVVTGHARVTVRFTADDPELALQIADHVVTATDAVAQPVAHTVTVRVKGRWFRIG